MANQRPPMAHRQAPAQHVAAQGGKKVKRRSRAARASRITRVLRRWFVLLLVLSAAALVFFQVLIIRNITFEGNLRFSTGELVQLTGIVYQDSMLRLDEEQVKANLSSNPYIAVENIEKQYPSTVHITVRERVAAAVTDFNGNTILLDTEGAALNLSAQDVKNDMCFVTGWQVTSAAAGQKIGTAQALQLSTYESIVTELMDQDFISHVREMDLTQLTLIELQLRNGMRVKLGNTDKLVQKIAWLVQMVPQLESEGYREGVLDVSAGNTASYTPGEGSPE